MTTRRWIGIGGVVLLICSGCVSTAQFERKLVETQQERKVAEAALRKQVAQLEQELQAARAQLEKSLADEARTREDQDKTLADNGADAQRTLVERIEHEGSLLAKELVGLHTTVADLSDKQDGRFQAESVARDKGDREIHAKMAELDARVTTQADRTDRAEALADARVAKLAQAQDQLRADVKSQFDDVAQRQVEAEAQLRDTVTDTESQLLATLTDRFAVVSAELSTLHDQLDAVRGDLVSARNDLKSMHGHLDAARHDVGSLQERLAQVDARLKSDLGDEAEVRANEDDCLFARVATQQAEQAAHTAALQKDLSGVTADIAEEIMAIRTELNAARQTQVKLAEAIASAPTTQTLPAAPAVAAPRAAVTASASKSPPTSVAAPKYSGAVARPCPSLVTPRAASKNGPVPMAFDEPEQAKLEPATDQTLPARPAHAAP